MKRKRYREIKTLLLKHIDLDKTLEVINTKKMLGQEHKDITMDELVYGIIRFVAGIKDTTKLASLIRIIFLLERSLDSGWYIRMNGKNYKVRLKAQFVYNYLKGY